MPSTLPTLALLENSGEMLVVFLLVLIFFGGEKLPEFARSLGKLIRDFKKAAAGVEEEIKRAMEEPKKEWKKIIAPPVPGTLDQLHELDAPPAPPPVKAEPPPVQPAVAGSEPASPVEPATGEPPKDVAPPEQGPLDQLHATDTPKTAPAQPESPAADTTG